MPQKKPQTEEQKKAMQKPFIYKKCPMTVKLTPGQQYLYCACGLSNKQPFCDGSHFGTKFKPIKFVAKNQTNSSICLCRRNDPDAGPYCDGTHADLEW